MRLRQDSARNRIGKVRNIINILFGDLPTVSTVYFLRRGFSTQEFVDLHDSIYELAGSGRT